MRVFAEIKKAHPDAALLMAGAEETDELRKLANQLGISDCIYFLGRRSDVPQLLSAMDVFVFRPLKRVYLFRSSKRRRQGSQYLCPIP